MSDIQTLITWCQEAREILRVTGGKKGIAAAALETELQKVARLLRELTTLAGESASIKLLHAEFERVAGTAHALSNNPKLLKLTPDALREQAKAVTRELTLLASKLERARPAAQDVAKYRQLMQNCQRERTSLQTQPYADVSDITNVINGAVLGEQALDDPALVKKALKVLDGFKGARELALKKQLKASQEAEVQLKMQAACRDRLRECRQALAAAQQALGMEAQAKLLDGALKAAEQLTGADRWSDALALLNGKGKGAAPLPSLADVQKEAGLTLAKQPPEARQAIEQLAVYKTLVDPVSHAEMSATVLQMVRSAAEYTPSSAAKMLTGALDLVKIKVEAATKMQREAQTLAQAAGQALLTDKDSLAVDEHQGLSDELQRVQADLSQRRLQRAVETADALLARVKQAVLDAGQASRQWTQIKGEFEIRLAALRRHAQDTAAPADARARCQRLADSTGRQSTLCLEGRDWATLVDLHQAMQDALDAFAKANGEYEKFSDERDSGNITVQDEVKATGLLLQQALSRLAREDGVDADAVLAPLRQQLADIGAAWTRKLASAASTDALGLNDTMAALTTLATKLDEVIQPEAIATARSTQADDASQQSFRGSVQTLETTFLAELARTDTAKGQALRERMDKLTADSTKPWADRVLLLDALGLEMKTATELAAQQGLDRAPGLLKRCDDLQGLLDLEHDKLKSTNDKAFEPLFIDITGRLADQRALATTPNTGAADAVTKALDLIAQQIGSIASRTGSGGSGGSGFDQVRKDLKTLQDAIDKASGDLSGNVPKTLATLKKLMLQFKTDMLGLTPEDARGEITALRASLDTALTESRDVSALRSGFATLKPVVESKINALAELRTVDAFVAVARQRVAALAKQAANPERLLLSKQQLDVLNKEVEDAYINPAKGLELQGKAQAEAERKRLQEVECKATLAHLRKAGVQRAAQAVKAGDGDGALVAEINRMLDDTATVIKGGDFSDALRKLRLVEQRIDEVVADPQGPGIGSRKALPKDAEAFTRTAAQLLADLGELPAMASSRLEALPGTVLDKLTQQLDGLTRRINPALFDAQAGQLSDKTVPVRERRATREAALLAIRNMRSLLSDHPQFAAVWSNPFHVVLKTDKAQIDQRLLRLEANIRRSVH